MLGLRIRWIGGLALVVVAALLMVSPMIARGRCVVLAPRDHG